MRLLTIWEYGVACMQDAILATKFYVPPTRTELVPRTRLITQLNEGLHRKLTLISAPAGFGKTTLAGEWVQHLQEDSAEDNPIVPRIAWLSQAVPTAVT